MKIKVFVLITFLTLFLAGCSRDKVHDDILNYINKDLSQIAQLETDALDAFNSVSGTNYQNDEIMYKKMVDTVIPRYKEFMEKLEKINPKTQELKEVHAIYVKSTKERYKAFTIVVTAIEKKDANMIQEANGYLTSAENGINEYFDRLYDLAGKHKVEIKDK